jgi:glycosyltransferase involved in cell wall biosynthesis
MKKISFIVIAFNEEDNIAECLDAILKQPGLNKNNYEIIVIDDCSKDNTVEIVTSYVNKNLHIKLYKLTPNQGRGAARAAGVCASSGEYLAFIDADTVIPAHWLNTCLTYIDRYDAVGGIALPDGDVSYVFSKFNLDPKIVVQNSTTVTGSNGLFKKEIFEVSNFDSKFRNGEDVVFNHQIKKNNFKLHLINKLVVAHKESKTFLESAKWLYQSGIGASRQLRNFRIIRLPDITFFGFLVVFALSIFLITLFRSPYFLNIILMYVLLTSTIHLTTKFKFHFRYAISFISAILSHSILLLCYFIGRTIGVFVARVPKTSANKNIIICFDFEGKWGMPFESNYDLVKTTRNLLDVLARYNVKAVFFVVGKIIEQYPNLIKEISGHGHEIAIHGYSHEHIDKLSKEEFVIFSDNLSRIELSLERLIGKRPIGFRSPYLTGPKFYSSDLYKILDEHGYRWVSNRELRYPEELFRPDRLNAPFMWGRNNWFTNILFILLNIRLILTETIYSKSGISRIAANLRWLDSGAEPFQRERLMEIPLYSPLDCDLLGLPIPEAEVSREWIKYSTACLTNGINRHGNLYNLTFHEWIIGSSNRILILEDILKTLRFNKDNKFITIPKI